MFACDVGCGLFVDDQIFVRLRVFCLFISLRVRWNCVLIGLLGSEYCGLCVMLWLCFAVLGRLLLCLFLFVFVTVGSFVCFGLVFVIDVFDLVNSVVLFILFPLGCVVYLFCIANLFTCVVDTG